MRAFASSLEVQSVDRQSSYPLIHINANVLLDRCGSVQHIETGKIREAIESACAKFVTVSTEGGAK